MLIFLLHNIIYFWVQEAQLCIFFTQSNVRNFTPIYIHLTHKVYIIFYFIKSKYLYSNDVFIVIFYISNFPQILTFILY